MNEIISATNLSVQFGEQVALQNLDFSVNEHDILVILGPNGGGKSTLLKTILGLVPYTGTIKKDDTKKLGYLPPQETVLKNNLPPLTVYDFFSFKTYLKSEMFKIVSEVGLTNDILDKQFATLSTGQFQRMLLAWTLIDKPSIIFLDEPLSGIDIAGEEAIYSLLHELWKKWNLTIILVTHNLNVIWKYATKVLCLNKKLLHFGTPEKTLTPELLKQVYGIDMVLYEHHHS